VLKRTFSDRAAWLPVIAATLLLASSIVAVSAEERVRLGAGVLARSRGSSQLLVLTHSSCNAENGNLACVQPNVDCVLCTQNTFTSLKRGTNGGYTASQTIFVTCGVNDSGKCNAALNCVDSGNVVGICHQPPKIVIQ
jgi:hypothetical protein